MFNCSTGTYANKPRSQPWPFQKDVTQWMLFIHSWLSEPLSDMSKFTISPILQHPIVCVRSKTLCVYISSYSPLYIDTTIAAKVADTSRNVFSVRWWLCSREYRRSCCYPVSALIVFLYLAYVLIFFRYVEENKSRLVYVFLLPVTHLDVRKTARTFLSSVIARIRHRTWRTKHSCMPSMTLTFILYMAPFLLLDQTGLSISGTRMLAPD